MFQLSNKNRGRFPKKIKKLSIKKKKISDDFMKYWHTVLRDKYSIVDKFNHEYVVNSRPKNFKNVLEIGAGDGEHLYYEKLNRKKLKNYFALDIRKNMLSRLNMEFVEVNSFKGDCQKKTIFKSNFFDRVIAIHVLEHLPNLPKALVEINRIIKKNGIFQVVIPCEGSLAYSIARKISAERIFKKKYNMSYKWFIEREHLNIPSEIFNELEKFFRIVSASYFPISVIPLEFCNLCIGLNLKKK
tara:strand:+ start:292 stop:1020 length:729 start_codon:yes stop_codon:yes gene_type:complete